MANGVSTEWHDLQVKFGNFEAKPVSPKQHALNSVAQDKMKHVAKLLDDSDGEIDPDLLDDDFVDRYQQQRMEQMKEFAKRPSFGTVYEISKDQYIEHVNNAPKENFVVIHLYQPHIETSNCINEYFIEFAKKYIHVKFIKMHATKCIENYPDANVPTFLIYKGGVLASHLSNVDKMYKKFSKINIERVLHEQGVLHNEKFDDPDEEIEDYKNILKNPMPHYKKHYHEGVDERPDDREYLDQGLKQHKF